jgi:hypothetical protein
LEIAAKRWLPSSVVAAVSTSEPTTEGSGSLGGSEQPVSRAVEAETKFRAACDAFTDLVPPLP